MVRVIMRALEWFRIEYNQFFETLPKKYGNNKEKSLFITFEVIIAAHLFRGMINKTNYGFRVRLFSSVYLDKRSKPSQRENFLLALASFNNECAFLKYGLSENEIVCQSEIAGKNIKECRIVLDNMFQEIEYSWKELMVIYYFDPDRYLDMGPS